jgi:hypothetical protein
MIGTKSRFGAVLLGALGIAAAVALPASATPLCQGVTSCIVGGTTYTETGGTSTATQTFLASFSTGNQSNATIAAEVLGFLSNDGFTGVMYLGRQDGSGLVDGDGVSVVGTGNLTGTWSFTPGTTGDIAEFVAIHAGGGQTDYLYEFVTPGTSGSWATLNGHGLSNFDLFGAAASVQVPEPPTIAMLGGAFLMLASFGAMRRKLIPKKSAA